MIIVRDRLRDIFNDRVVGIGHDVEFPPRSPDLTPMDSFVWGNVKGRVHDPPQSSGSEAMHR